MTKIVSSVTTLCGLLVKLPGKVPLQMLLVIPFVVQIIAAVGLTGYLGFHNGQKAVDDLATQLQNEIIARIDQHLDTYLSIAHQINQSNADAIDLELLNPHDFEKTGLYFWKQLQLYPNVGYISFGSAAGEYIGAGRYPDGTQEISELSYRRTGGKSYAYYTDSQGKRINPPYDIADAYNFKLEAWYADPVRIGKPVWSQIYQWEGYPQYVSIALSYPVYNASKKLIGVLSVDQQLAQISNFLHQLKVSKSGKTFILERNGLLVASSTQEPAFKIINEQAKRIPISQAQSPLIRASFQYLNQKFSNLNSIKSNQQLQFRWNGERQFLHVSAWRDRYGLDWLIVVVIPESDFMAQIHENNRTTLLLCLVALLLALLLGLVTSRWITQPIIQLSQAARAISSGQIDQKVELDRSDELGILAQSFNQMAAELKKLVNELEERVLERTAQLQEAKENADTANRAKSIFLANMSHELRTPLNAILGFTQIMERDRFLNAAHQEYLGIINRSGEHLLELINNILSIAKIESGKITFQEKAFNLYRLLDSLEEMLRLRAITKGIELSIQPSWDIPQNIETDEGKLRQVLLNLLGNSIKFTEFGSVTLRVKRGHKTDSQKTRLFFEVEDTGAGIDSAEIQNLFTPFFQTQTGRKSQEGTGLGLAISRQFIQLMGGDIKVSSQVGKGTIFQFDIEVNEVESLVIQPHQETQRALTLAPNQPHYRLLVVDDVADNRNFMIQLLRPLGFEIQEAENGQEGVTLWESFKPHLIWMDMRMPILDGYEAIKQIRAKEQQQQEQGKPIHRVIIIAVTASAFDQERSPLLSMGCDDFVLKPVSEVVLLDKLTQYLGASYLYADPNPVLNGKSSAVNREIPLDQLAEIPGDLLSAIHQHALCADDEAILQRLQQFPAQNYAITQILRDWTYNFRFDLILELTQNPYTLSKEPIDAP